MSKESKITIGAVALATVVSVSSCTWAVRTNDISREYRERIAEQKILIQLYSDRLENEHERVKGVEAVLEAMNKEKAETELENWQ